MGADDLRVVADQAVVRSFHKGTTDAPKGAGQYGARLESVRLGESNVELTLDVILGRAETVEPGGFAPRVVRDRRLGADAHLNHRSFGVLFVAECPPQATPLGVLTVLAD